MNLIRTEVQFWNLDQLVAADLDKTGMLTLTFSNGSERHFIGEAADAILKRLDEAVSLEVDEGPSDDDGPRLGPLAVEGE